MARQRPNSNKEEEKISLQKSPIQSSPTQITIQTQKSEEQGTTSSHTLVSSF